MFEGTIIRGSGSATQNIEWQMPYFREIFPEIEHCYSGSINVKLQKPLRGILKPDFETPPIKWHPWDIYKNIEEKFSFTRIKFEIIEETNRLLTDAWIYDPHNSPNRSDLFLIEILAPKIDIRNNKLCRIYVDGDKIPEAS